MTVKIVCFGKVKESYLAEMLEAYLKRLKHYLKIEYAELNDTPRAQEAFLNQIVPGEQIILLDETGREYSSVEFATFLRKKFNSSGSNITFLIGGAYGFEKILKERAGETLALSKMTFTHQMVRLIFLEQLYRAMTILKNEKYHH